MLVLFDVFKNITIEISIYIPFRQYITNHYYLNFFKDMPCFRVIFRVFWVFEWYGFGQRSQNYHH